MKTHPLVSVIMPTFNRIQYLGDAVDSVIEQDFDDWELIIVDDGSDEPVREYLRGLGDPRVHVDYRRHTGIPAAARNAGIALARGKYVAFIDSDDRWVSKKLQKQLELMQSAPERRWSYSAIRSITENGSTVKEAPTTQWIAFDGSIIEQLLLIEAQVATPAVMAELSLVREVGGFDESLRFIEDYDLWSRLALRSEVSVEQQPLAEVRHHPHQFTWDDVGKHGGWTRYYEKMERLVPTEQLQRLCRNRKRTSVLTLASAQARAGNWQDMLHRLRNRIIRAGRFLAGIPLPRIRTEPAREWCRRLAARATPTSRNPGCGQSPAIRQSRRNVD